MKFAGLNAALVTPFDEDEAIDWGSLERLVAYLADGHQVPGLVTSVNAGEGWALSVAEQAQVVQTVRRTAGPDTAIIAGITGRGLQDCLAAVEATQKAGADALLVLPLPEWSLGADSDSVMAHFEEVARNSSVPVGVFQFPSVSPGHYSTALLADLVAIPNVALIKEAQWDNSLLAEEVDVMRTANPDISVLSGVDLHIYESLQPRLEGMLLAAGCIVPRQLMTMHAAIRQDRDAEARAEKDEIQPLLDLIYDREPFGRRHAWLKSCLHHLGLIDTPIMRRPAFTVSELDTDLVQEMARLKLADDIREFLNNGA